MSFSYFRHLDSTGSVCPSSHRLARAVADVADRKQSSVDKVVFAGIGNGVVAKQFLHWSKNITFIDIEEAFCESFTRSVSRSNHQVVCSDVGEYLSSTSDGLERLVVSCLPLHGPYFCFKVVNALIDEVRRGGAVVFYTYFPFIRGTHLARSLSGARLAARRERTIIGNVPPAHIFSITSEHGPSR